MSARNDDMALEKVFAELSPDQESLLRELIREHPNDLRVIFDKGVAYLRARQSHWLGYVEYMITRTVNDTVCKKGDLVAQNHS